MPRAIFEQELERLQEELAKMGRRVDERLQTVLRCLRTGDREQARALFRSDVEINVMEKHIEQGCMNLLALQQPLASDLRLITATLKAITDMERIADQCADIGEILTTVPGLVRRELPPRLLQMGERARQMFVGALDAFLRRDAQAGERVCAADDEVDTLFSTVVLELCGKIDHTAGAVPETVDCLFIAKYMERMADHATNIAEWAIFVPTGRHPDLNDASHPDHAIIDERKQNPSGHAGQAEQNGLY